jgi:hypothetical protein
MEKIGTDSGDCLAAKMVRKQTLEKLAAAFAAKLGDNHKRPRSFIWATTQNVQRGAQD